ncbi:hypothetical protein Lal_00016070 [Lupinus albus]|uniref:Uncharacterized protein n=1 Tax=Lupinus albus TaxID=3870 RepID=A0A6A5MQI5_LUPAL|nr:hypothetical protein Lalb_Chr05g0220231 [Lupinus albus]KAF1872962.1 hypothetical protein Lal_00016070 [Lupinus albus]
MFGLNPKPFFDLSILFLVLLFCSSTESLRFELQSSATKCISEDIKSKSMTVGKYSVVNHNEGHPLPDSHRFSVVVKSPFGNNYHNGDRIQSGQFGFLAAESGDYVTCFTATEHDPKATLTIDFEWKSGVAAKDWSTVAKRGQVDVMELEIRKLYETAADIHEEMNYLHDREEEMQEFNRTTNDRMFWFSFLSLIVCLSVAGLQLWYLKTFFEKKKLI